MMESYSDFHDLCPEHFLVIFIGLSFLGYQIYMRHRKKNTYPIVPFHPLLGNINLIHSQDLHKTLHQYSTEHGPIFYIHIYRQKYLVINSDDIMREVLNRDHSSDRTHEYAAEKVSFKRCDIGFTDMNEAWAKMRKFGSKSLFSSMRAMDELFYQEAMDVMQTLKNCSTTKSYEEVITDVHTDTVTKLVGLHLCYYTYISHTFISCCRVGSVTWRFVTRDDIVIRGPKARV